MTTTVPRNVLFVSATNLLKVFQVSDTDTGAIINTAIVTARLLDPNGELVPDSEITLPYVADSAGNYSGTWDATLALVVDTFYTVELTVTAGALVDFRRFDVPAVHRGPT